MKKTLSSELCSADNLLIAEEEAAPQMVLDLTDK